MSSHLAWFHTSRLLGGLPAHGALPGGARHGGRRHRGRRPGPPGVRHARRSRAAEGLLESGGGVTVAWAWRGFSK